jgi:benzoylformate decarboxylase
MTDQKRIGAQAFLEQLIASGVEWIFGNPGTTEQTVVDYIQDYPELGLILALHEGVAVGAADGYARASGRLGVVQLHAGPGLGNAIGNMYNAFISHTPMLVYTGQSPQRALYQEPVLTADLVAMAAPVTKWAYEIRTADEIPQVTRRAVKVATTPPCGPVLLSIPLDLTDEACAAPVLTQAPAYHALRPDPAAVDAAARALRTADRPLIIAGDAVATSGAIDAVSRLAALLGAPLMEGAAFETVADPGDPLLAGRIPASAAAAARLAAGHDVIVAVGTRVLAQVFPGDGLPLGDATVIHVGADDWELAKSQPSLIVRGDERASTEELTAALTDGAPPAWLARGAAEAERIKQARVAALTADQRNWDAVPMTPQRALAEVGAALPDGACVIDEAMSSYEAASRYLPRRRGAWFRGAGGIGMGLPRAVGAQLADPGRPVVAVVGDGASMYSLTALWTAAHHRLPVTWVILANRSYRTLKQNVAAGRQPGAADHAFVGADLTDPVVDFTALAAGFGVRAWRAEHPGEVGPALRAAAESGGPALIELIVSGEL